jgi:hypothetical protein
MLEKEYDYYKKHLPEFLKDHSGEFVVIQGESVNGYYPSEAEALASMKEAELGTFFVKQCLPLDETIAQYYSRAVFA